MSSLPMLDTGVALPSFAGQPKPAVVAHGLLGGSMAESSLGGDLLAGRSVLRSAAGIPMAVLGW